MNISFICDISSKIILVTYQLTMKIFCCQIALKAENFKPHDLQNDLLFIH